MAETGAEGIEAASKTTAPSREGSVAVLIMPDERHGGRMVQEPVTISPRGDFDRTKWEPRLSHEQALALLDKEEEAEGKEQRSPRTPDEMRQVLENDPEAHLYFHQQKDDQLTVPAVSDSDLSKALTDLSSGDSELIQSVMPFLRKYLAKDMFSDNFGNDQEGRRRWREQFLNGPDRKVFEEFDANNKLRRRRSMTPVRQALDQIGSLLAVHNKHKSLGDKLLGYADSLDELIKSPDDGAREDYDDMSLEEKIDVVMEVEKIAASALTAIADHVYPEGFETERIAGAQPLHDEPIPPEDLKMILERAGLRFHERKREAMIHPVSEIELDKIRTELDPLDADDVITSLRSLQSYILGDAISDSFSNHEERRKWEGKWEKGPNASFRDIVEQNQFGVNKMSEIVNFVTIVPFVFPENTTLNELATEHQSSLTGLITGEGKKKYDQMSPDQRLAVVRKFVDVAVPLFNALTDTLMPGAEKKEIKVT